MKPITYWEWFRQWRMRRQWLREQTSVESRPHDD